jgi:hypothetical protein
MPIPQLPSEGCCWAASFCSSGWLRLWQYPLIFLDRINSPQKLIQQFDSDLRDDLTRTGVFNREELDETFSTLARLLYGHKQTGYAFNPALNGALRQFVARWQNSETGFWGQWLVDRQGRIWKMDDMAMTFHVVSDLHGDVEHKDLIANVCCNWTRSTFLPAFALTATMKTISTWMQSRFSA